MAKQKGLEALVGEVRSLRQRGWSFPEIEADLKRKQAALVEQALAQVRQEEGALVATKSPATLSPAPVPVVPSPTAGHYTPQPTGCAGRMCAPQTPL